MNVEPKPNPGVPSRAPRTEASATPFSKLGLAPALCAAVERAGYSTPTPIQRQAIPLVLQGHDLLGCAQTGTGKTAAFALPILHQLLARKGPASSLQALILAPTRELAAQIGEELGAFSERTPLRHLVVFGGVNRARHVRALKRPPSILVATPGRLLDLMSTRDVSLAQVRHLVLDEADRMLDMGFIRDVRRIVEACPRTRQTLLFSATMPPAIEELAKRSMVDPRQVAVDPVSSAGAPIRQGLYLVPKLEKTKLLITLLGREDEDMDRLLVFARTKRGADRLADKLSRAGFDAAAIHGNKSQGARERALQQFKERRLRVLVATDLASRGIDVKDLSGVLNYDLPQDAESYIHRVGRTGRAGAAGTALSFCCEEELPLLRQIERLTRKPIERLVMEGEGTPDQPPPSRREPVRSTEDRARPRRRRRRPARACA